MLSSGSTFLWQRYRALGIFEGKAIPPAGMPVEPALEGAFRAGIFEDRVLANAKLHEGERRLFVGWVWFSGTITDEDGNATTYCFPAISIPVVAQGETVSDAGDVLSTGLSVLTGGAWSAEGTPGRLVPDGDIDLTDLIEQDADRRRLLDSCNFGDGALRDIYIDQTGEYTPVDISIFPRLDALNSWIDDVAKTVGLPVSSVKAAHQGSPVHSALSEGITVHIGSALYLESPSSHGTRRESLLRLARLEELEQTSLGTLYRNEHVESETADAVRAVRPLSRRQQAMAKDALNSPLSVLSGGPGTGKSHVLSVLAMNAIAQGDSVLVVAGSPHAVDVLAEHFTKTPGPPPIVFGGSRHGQQLSRDLAELASRTTITRSDRGDVADYERMIATSHRRLELEAEVVRIQRDPTSRIDLVHARDRAGDLDELERLIDQCERRGPAGWIARRRNPKKLDDRLGTSGDYRATLDQLVRGAEAQRLDAEGGLSLAETYDLLAQIETTAAQQAGAALTEQWLERMSAEQKTALTQISTALTVGRAARRAKFAEMRPGDLTVAAPLWIGSIRDVEDVLPEVAGLFDLLLIDEAAQIDQLNAVNALARAKRAVICGDPRQLDHSSYMSEDDKRVASNQDPLDGDLLDVHKLSLFDVGASRVSTLVLDEHFRSAPHIIEFSARRMYDGRLHVVGRNPANESADHIQVVNVEGVRNDDGVNSAEVDASIRAAEELIEEGHRSIGFISPFDAQASALEEAILDRWQLEEIDAYGLRVGTVHGFQGDERDVIIASWAIGPDEGNNVWSHVNQPNLFNVMVTRARTEVVVVTSTPEPPGLAGDYIRWSEPLTNLVRDVALDDPWIAEVAEMLSAKGWKVRVGYPVGRHLVDLVVSNGDPPIAIDCMPHVDGPESHTDRALQLRRMGWRTADAFESRWRDRLGELAIELEHI